MTIDSHPPAEIADTLFVYAGGPRNHHGQFITPFYLESPELLNAAGLAMAADRVTLHVRMPDGGEQDLSMLADPPDPDWKWWVYSDAYLSTEQIASADSGWKSYLASDAKLPLAIADLHNPFHAASESGIYYAGFRSNDADYRALKDPVLDYILGVAGPAGRL